MPFLIARPRFEALMTSSEITSQNLATIGQVLRLSRCRPAERWFSEGDPAVRYVVWRQQALSADQELKALSAVCRRSRKCAVMRVTAQDDKSSAILPACRMHAGRTKHPPQTQEASAISTGPRTRRLLRGRRTMTSVPMPTVERIRMVPPCSSISDLAMARPSPEP